MEYWSITGLDTALNKPFLYSPFSILEVHVGKIIKKGCPFHLKRLLLPQSQASPSPTLII